MISEGAFHKSLFVCCAEAFFFISDSQTQTFEEMMSMAGCDVLEIYRAVGTFMVFDSCMPLPLRRHFIDIEVDIISRIAWKNARALESYQNAISSDKENMISSDHRMQEMPLNNQFFNRVLLYAATQMYHLCNGLPITDDLMEYMWAVLKFIMTQKLELLRNRHLDQMVFCTIYCVSKLFKVQLKFQDIINKYVYSDIGSRNCLSPTKLELTRLYMRFC